MYQFINYKKASKLFFITFIFLSICNLSYSNIVEELTALNNLYKQGAITKEEFSKAKSIILKSESKVTSKDTKKVEPDKKIKKENFSQEELNQEAKVFDLTNTFRFFS